MKAESDDDDVFAIALEDGQSGSISYLVLVQFDSSKAKEISKQRSQDEEDRKKLETEGGLFGGTGFGEEEEAEKGLIQKLFEEYTRATLASIIAIGSLFFIMYTFRSTILSATLAVGRNPRARNAIMTVSVENIIFALIICAVAIFIAIAVLVLPV